MEFNKFFLLKQIYGNVKGFINVLMTIILVLIRWHSLYLNYRLNNISVCLFFFFFLCVPKIFHTLVIWQQWKKKNTKENFNFNNPFGYFKYAYNKSRNYPFFWWYGRGRKKKIAGHTGGITREGEILREWKSQNFQLIIP